MKRVFIFNLLFLLAINLVIKPLYIFGVDREIQNLADPGSYGLYFELFNFTFLFQILNDFGIQYYNNRHIARHPYLLPKYFPYLLGTKAILGGLYFLTVLVFAAAAGYLEERPDLLILLLAVQLLNSLFSYLRSNISGLGWYYTDSFLSVLDKLILICLLGIPVWRGFFSGGFPIAWLVYGQVFSLLFSVFIAMILLWRKTGVPKLKWNPRLIRLMIKYSYPYALAVVLMTLYTRIDAVMIGRMLPEGKMELGWYAAAYRLLDAVNMVGFLFAGLLLPMFSRLHRENGDLEGLSNLGIRLIWSGVLILSPAVIMFSDSIMDVLYVHNSPRSGAIFSWLMLSFIPVSGGYIFGTLLLASGHQKKLNGLYFSGVVLNVLMNVLLIPRLKAEGAAMTTFITQTFVFCGILYFSWAWQKVKISWNSWLRFFALGSSTALVAFLLEKFFFPTYGWFTLLAAFLSGGIGVFCFRLFRVKEFYPFFWKNA